MMSISIRFRGHNLIIALYRLYRVILDANVLKNNKSFSAHGWGMFSEAVPESRQEKKKDS